MGKLHKKKINLLSSKLEEQGILQENKKYPKIQNQGRGIFISDNTAGAVFVIEEGSQGKLGKKQMLLTLYL